jgi:uroporphyrinogen III methyltransferase/synthase
MISFLLAPAGDKRNLVAELQRIETKVFTWPALEIGQPESQAALDEAIENLFGYDWLLLKNANAARCFLDRFKELNHSLDELDNLRLCVIGDETAAAIRNLKLHIEVEVTSSTAAFAALECYVGGRDALSGVNLLVPSASVTQEKFQNDFQKVGARFDRVTAYRTTADSRALTQTNALLVGAAIDFVLFGNGAEIEELAQLFDTDDLKAILRESTVICADQAVRTAAISFGLPHVLIPSEPTIDGVLRLISPTNVPT